MATKWITLSRFWNGVFVTVSIWLSLWLLFSLVVSKLGGAKVWSAGNRAATRTAIIIYNLDPFYNFDEQLSKTFATRLADNGWFAEVITVKVA